MLVFPAAPLPVPFEPAALAGPSTNQPATAVLRCWEPADAPALVSAWNDPDLAGGAPPAPRRTVAEAEAWISRTSDRLERSLALDLVLASLPGPTGPGEVLGEVGLSEFVAHRRGAVLGYWIGKAHRGHGLATAAVGAFCTWVLADGLDVLAARVARDNLASIRVLEKVGFSLPPVHGGAASGLRSSMPEGKSVDPLVYFLKRDALRARSG